MLFRSEWLAKHEGAQEPIATLHEALLEKNIWLWTKGAIEAHLGLQKKDEQEWAQFKQAAESNGIDDSLDDAVRKMLQWLRDDATSDASTAGMIDLPVTETSGTD